MRQPISPSFPSSQLLGNTRTRPFSGATAMSRLRAPLHHAQFSLDRLGVCPMPAMLSNGSEWVDRQNVRAALLYGFEDFSGSNPLALRILPHQFCELPQTQRVVHLPSLEEIRPQGIVLLSDAETMLSEIFPPFRGVASGDADGAGLGLAIGQRAVNVHHGAIRAMNATGGGLIVEIKSVQGSRHD